MQEGVCKTWTPWQEELWARRLEGCRTFAVRHLLMTIRDQLKYDGRTKQGEKAIANARLRLAVATDKDLEEIAELENMIPEQELCPSITERLEELKRERAEIQAKGIRREDLQCQ